MSADDWNQDTIMTARVIRSVTAQLDEEIDLFEGDIVTITSVIDDTWYRGVCGERTGIFPSSHVELLQPYSDLNCHDVSTTVEPANTYRPSSISSRELFRQCSESANSQLNSSISSRQIYTQCVDSATFELGSFENGFENEKKNIINHPQVSTDVVPHGVTLYPFCAQFDNELNFQVGEVVTLIRHIDKYWMEGEIKGKKGIFPANYITVLVDCKETAECGFLAEEGDESVVQKLSANSYAKVMYNFDAQMAGDLSVKEDEQVLVLESINNDWCHVQNGVGEVGSVPCVYLSQVQEDSCVEIKDSMEAVHEPPSYSPECATEACSDVFIRNSSSRYRMPASGAIDLDAALSQNLAELSLSICHGHKYNAVARMGASSMKDTKSTKMLTIEAHGDENKLSAQTTGDTHLKSTESLTTEADELVLRHGSEKASETLAEVPKRESIDRMPHRPAPPAPVLTQKPSEMHGPPVVHLHASGTDVPLNLDSAEEHKPENERKKNIEQRQNVISELVFTEKEFSRDMKITFETFNLHNPSFLESYGVDVKLLFGNILEVIHVSEDFTDELLLALKGKSEENQCVGQCFLKMASRMKSVYSEYTVNHDNVLTLLEKYDSDASIKRVLDKGVETLRYQISCFDMGSILIKPVQRVLKYPLIVNELIKYTEDDHEDKPDLLKAVLAMMDVANDINENKRRKDIVVKYLEDSPSTISSRISRISLHSVAKKSSRIGALLSSSLGIKTGARDELYDEQENLFYTLDKMIRLFLKNAEMFVASLQETFFIKCVILENIVSLYDDETTFEVDQYCNIVKNISSQFLNEFKRTVDTRVSIPLTLLLKCFEGPWKLVQKRYDKLLDYEAYYSKMDKSKDRQGTINILRNNFTALNNQLLEELPELITLSCEVFAECVKVFVLARKLFMGKVTKQYLTLFSEISEANTQIEDALEHFAAKHALAWTQLISSLSFIKQPKSDTGLGGVSRSLTSSTKGIFPDISTDPCTQSSSQQAYLQSYYHVSRLYKVVKSYTAKEYLELTVSEGQLLAVIKKQNPMGDPKIWFVDNGANQGFVPCFCLASVESNLTGQSMADQAMDQIDQVPASSRSVKLASAETDCPPSYEAVVLENNDAAGHFYEEIKDDELFYVLHDLTSSADHVLQVSRGQVVKVLHKEDFDGNPEWWFVEDKFKNVGYVPANYLSKYD